jgi:glucose/arabinose dehydrogenase
MPARVGGRPSATWFLLAISVILSGAACSRSGAAQPQNDGELAQRLTIPAGLHIEYFAHLGGARWLVLGPDGSVYVSVPGHGDIVRFFATNAGTGLPDSQAVVARGLHEPHGMAFHKGFFYVANTDGVVRFAVDARGVPTGQPAYVNHYGFGSGHSTRTILFGPDSAMYVSIGSSCNVCVERDSTRATVMRFDEDGSHGRVFARGLRNAVGLAVNPTTHVIWATQNERDNLEPDHQNAPPDELNLLQAGGDYGWPYCWGDRIPNPEFHDRARCATTIPPALGFQAHSAVLGITFLDHATQLPHAMREDALAAFHGSWNRDVPTGDKIVRIHIADGQPVSYDDFITGWQLPNGSRWGRVADVIVAADGSLLITDDQAGAVYRVYR